MQRVQKAIVLINEHIGTISPYLHGQFAEHLGELVYPGIWVGEDSPIPNTGGIRTDVVEALKRLELPVLRWPGGCFADAYHWRDGVGPQEERPLRVNVHWGMAPEPNNFGTHEFAKFCELIGSEPYFAANVGSGTPEELMHWVEYCNFAGDSTLSRERRTNGQDEPFNIRFWGIGNENWGCGGCMNPEQYADLYMRFRTYVYRYPGSAPFAIAAGPNCNDFDWTRRFFERATRHYANRSGMIQGFAAHYYCGTTGESATDYSANDWLEQLAKARAVEGLIVGHRSIMDKYDPDRNVKLILDEWGSWHVVQEGKPVGGLYQQNTMRDAHVSALTLDVLNNHADKVYMANIAQMINVLQALLLVEGTNCIKTPTYHVFDLYRPHKGANAVTFLTAGESLSDGGSCANQCSMLYLDNSKFTLKALEGSASTKDGALCVTACNTHPTECFTLELETRGANIDEAEVIILKGEDYLSHNTFENPSVVTLSEPTTIKARNGLLHIDMPAASIARIMGKIS